MTDIRLKTVERQDDPPLPLKPPAQVVRVAELSGEHLIVAVEQVGDATLSNGHAAGAQDRVDLRDRAVIAVAQDTHQRDHIEAELVLRQSQSALRLRTVGLVEPGAAGRLTPADLQAQPFNASERHQGAAVLVADPHRAAAPAACILSRTIGSDRMSSSRGSPMTR